MQLIIFLFVALAGFILASFLALLSYGRFAERVRGELSTALSVSESGTTLDGLVEPLIAQRPGQSGMVLLSSNLDAFAARVLTVRLAWTSNTISGMAI